MSPQTTNVSGGCRPTSRVQRIRKSPRHGQAGWTRRARSRRWACARGHVARTSSRAWQWPRCWAAREQPSPGLPGSAGPPTPRFRHFGPLFGLGGSLFGALHGEFVVGKSGGGYETVDVQNGQVTAVSTTSITLKSADGFTKSYAVTGSTLVDAQRDGIGSVKVGNQASVQATVSGSTATAISIEDLTLLQQERPQFGMAPPGNVGAQAG